MTKRKQTTPKAPPDADRPPVEQALLNALAAQPDATAADLAAAASVGRSTASKALARLQQAGQVRRTPGGRKDGRRLPDRWAPVRTNLRGGKRDTTKTNAAAADRQSAGNGGAGDRLRPGQLDGLVLAYLKQNAQDGPLGPTAIAKALGRSSGAIGNCLVRLTRNRQVRETSEKPRRYKIAT